MPNNTKEPNSLKMDLSKVYDLLIKKDYREAQLFAESSIFSKILANVINEFLSLENYKRSIICYVPIKSEQEIVFSPTSTDARGVVITFGGLNGMLGGIPIVLWDYIFASLNLNAVYIPDTKRTMYLEGIEGLEPTIVESAEKLKALLEEESQSDLPVYVLSTSAGGMANFIYGNLLNAKVCLAFSPLFDAMLEGENRARAIVRRLLKTNTPENLSLVSHLDSGINFKKGVIVYGENNIEDSRQANQFMEYKENIEIVCLEGIKKHNTCSSLLFKGELVNFLNNKFNDFT